MTDHRIDSEKLSLHPVAVANWLCGFKVQPLYVEISPVKYCNHKCSFCGLDASHGKEQIEKDLMLMTIDELVIHGTKAIVFAGAGEPMLYKGLSEAIAQATNSGIDVGLVTNGSVDNNLNDIVKDCSWIRVSFDAGDTETYKTVHGVDQFDKVIENIKRMLQIRNSSKSQCKISMQFLMIKENFASLKNFIQLAKDIGVDYVILKPYSQHLKSENKMSIDYSEYHDTCSSLAKQFTDNTFSVIYRANTALRKEKKYKKCYSVPFFWTYIEADGNVYACSCHIGDDRFILGNINKESFTRIWDSDKKNQNIELMKTFDISNCRHNCRAESINEYLWRLKNKEQFDNFI